MEIISNHFNLTSMETENLNEAFQDRINQAVERARLHSNIYGLGVSDMMREQAINIQHEVRMPALPTYTFEGDANLNWGFTTTAPIRAQNYDENTSITDREDTRISRISPLTFEGNTYIFDGIRWVLSPAGENPDTLSARPQGGRNASLNGSYISHDHTSPTPTQWPANISRQV